MQTDYAALAVHKHLAKLGENAPKGASPIVKLDPSFKPSKPGQTPDE